MESLTIRIVACLFLLAIGGFMKSGATPYSASPNEIAVDTVAYTDARLAYTNGTYLYDSEAFSGVVHQVLEGFDIQTYSTVLEGRLHGAYRSYYASGQPYEVRTYRNGLATGTHTGYWEGSGNRKFEYHYQEQKKEGTHRTWYANGDPAEAYTYHDDRLDGLQQAWRDNGSLYRNFVVKDGTRYGLQKSKTCYEVSDGRVVLQADKLETKQTN